jgi:hypothetical protein
MEKKRLRERMSDWFDRNREKIDTAENYALVASWSCVAGELIMHGIYRHQLKNSVIVDQENAVRVLKDVINNYQGKSAAGFPAYTSIVDTGLTPDQLGEIGKHIIASGGANDWKFTHFIAVGKPLEK